MDSKNKKISLIVIFILFVLSLSLIFVLIGSLNKKYDDKEKQIIKNGLMKYNSLQKDIKQENSLPSENYLPSLNTIENVEQKNNVIEGFLEYKSNLISFQYPSDWTFFEDFNSKKTKSNVSNVLLLGNQYNNLRISIEKTPVDITTKKYFEETVEKMKTVFHKYQLIKEGQTIVSGRESFYRLYKWLPEEEELKSKYPEEWTRIKQYQLYVAGKEHVFVITFTSKEEDFNNNYPIYEKILKTMTLE